MVCAETYERVALEEPDEHWELHNGCLRRKPPMSYQHGSVLHRLAFDLYDGLKGLPFEVRLNHARTRRSSRSYYIPDIAVIPTAVQRAASEPDPASLEVYEAPLPLVVEVWSPSTGEYDVDEKLPEYQRRGDRTIMRVHPYERTVTVWRKQPDGSYVETLYREGVVLIETIGVAIDLARLFP